jgi:RNA polymerase sigma-70 factor, ECF subfamily
MSYGAEIEGIAPRPTHTHRGAQPRARASRSTVLRELVERAAKGDQEAFASLVQVSSGRLYAVAYRILRDPYLAEDALQQTLITIWNELPRLRDPDRFEAWSYRVIVRASTAEAKRGKRAASTLRLLPDDADRAVGSDELGAVAERDRLDRAFKRITADQRAVLVMQHYLGLTPVEMSEVLGIPVGTVGSRLHYATRALRTAIEADERMTSSEERSA